MPRPRPRGGKEVQVLTRRHRSRSRIPRRGLVPIGHGDCSLSSVSQKANPALLANADYYGTLAAARSLGRYGVPVTVAHENHLGAASWSRFIADSCSCPPTSDSRAFLSWLIAFGAAHPGHVLYPTSDDSHIHSG